MNKLLKVGTLLSTYFMLPLSFLAADMTHFSFETCAPCERINERNQKFARKKFQKKIVDRGEVQMFPADDLEPIAATSAVFIPELTDTLNVAAIELPYSEVSITLNPGASLGFRIPYHYIPSKHSFLSIPFFTTSSLSPVVGEVSFHVQADFVNDRQTTTGTELVSVGKGRVKLVSTSGPATLGAEQVNYYVANIPLRHRLFRPGDYVYLKIERTRSPLNDFADSVFITGVDFEYNIGLK
ncbi:MAG: hypothetical protein ACH350_03470 [Parachlamydiaceae bacterium]